MKLLLLAVLFAGLVCPLHPDATCYETGVTQYLPDGHQYMKWHCSCGDDYWKRND